MLRAAAFIEPSASHPPADKPPTGSNWIHEIKHDGYRLMARRDPVGIRLITRGGHDWSGRYPLVVEAVNHLKVRSCLIDGEVVCCDERGWPPGAGFIVNGATPAKNSALTSAGAELRSSTLCAVEKHDRRGSDGDFAARRVVMCPLCTRCPRYSQLAPKSTENVDAWSSGLAAQRDEGAESIRYERIRTAKHGGEIGFSENEKGQPSANRLTP